MNKKPLLLVLAVVVLLASCSAGFKKKMEVAEGLRHYFEAKNVHVGYKSESSGSDKKAETTLTFSGVSDKDWDDLGLSMTAGLVAWKFMKEMPEAMLKDETHVAVVVETTDGAQHEYEFPMEDLREADALLPVTDKAVIACMKQDRDVLHGLDSQEYLPDSVLEPVHAYAAQNDSIFAGMNRSPLLRGFRWAAAEDDPALQLFCTLYLEEHTRQNVRYDINVERKTKKVVYLGIHDIDKK